MLNVVMKLRQEIVTTLRKLTVPVGNKTVAKNLPETAAKNPLELVQGNHVLTSRSDTSGISLRSLLVTDLAKAGVLCREMDCL